MRPSESPDLYEAAEYSTFNREGLANSERAMCYYCRAIYPATEVTDFTDGGQTATCPFCGVDAVLHQGSGYPFDSDTLKDLHEFWFGETE